MQRQQKVSRGAVGTVNGEAPAQAIRLIADGGAVAHHKRFIFLFPALCSPGGNRARPFGLYKLYPSRIRKRLFGRIYDLDSMAMCAIC
jgi:hypothetical protein